MAIATISNTGGLYSASSSWVGNFVPTSADDVTSTVTSGPLTVDTPSVAKSVNFGPYTSTLTMNSGLTVSGNVTLGLTMSISGTHGIVVNSSATMSSNGKIWPNQLTLSGTSTTFTLIDDWVVDSLRYSTTNGSISTTNGKTITASNGLTIATTAQTVGTTKIILTGGTWSHTSAGRISMSIDLNGNVNFGSNIYSGGGTISYVSGTINTTGNTFSLQTGTLGLVNTNSINFNNFLSTGTSVINGGNLNLLGNLTINSSISGNSTIVMKGSGTWSGSGILSNNLTFDSGSDRINVSGTVYKNSGTVSYVSGSMSTVGSTLYLQTSGSLVSLGFDTGSMSWNDMYFHITTANSTMNLNLLSNLNITGTLYIPVTGPNSVTIPAASFFYTFSGSGSFNPTGSISIGNIFGVGGAGSSQYVTLPNDITLSSFQWNSGGLAADPAGKAAIFNGNKKIRVTGNFTNIGIVGTNLGGNCTVELLGSGNFTLNGASTNLNLDINSSGTYSFLSTPIFSGSNIRYLSGRVTQPANIYFIGCTLSTSGLTWSSAILRGNTGLLEQFNVNNILTETTEVRFLGTNSVNVAGNLTTNISTTGSNTIFISGTSSQTWSGTSNLANNLVVNKTTGTFSISGTVYYSSGTFSYLSGAVSTSNSTFAINGSSNLSTSGITWSNISNTATGNINLLNNLTWTGTWSATTGTITFTGSGLLTPTSTSRINFSGSSNVTAPDSVIGYTFSSITITTSGITTLRGNLLTTGLLTLGGSGNINSFSGLTGSITTTGGLSMTGNCSGTAFISLNGGSWSGSGILQNNLRFDGNSAVSGSVYYQTGTISYVSGSISTTSSLLYIPASANFDTSILNWNRVLFYNTSTINLASNLTSNRIDINFDSSNSANITFTGSGNLNISNTLSIGNGSFGGLNGPYYGTAVTLPGHVTVPNLAFRLGYSSKPYNVYSPPYSFASTVNSYSITVTDSFTVVTNDNVSPYTWGNFGYYVLFGTIDGTSEFIITGRTFSSSGSNRFYIANPITFNPVNSLNISTSIANQLNTFYYRTGRLKYIGGTISTSMTLEPYGATLSLGSFSWGNIDWIATNYLESNLYCNRLTTKYTTDPIGGYATQFNSAYAAGPGLDILINSTYSVYTRGLNINATTNGTTPIIFNQQAGSSSGTWSHGSVNYVTNNIFFDANTAVSGNVYYQSGTISHISGNINTSGSTLNITGTTRLNTGGMTWSNVTLSNTTTQILSNLKLSGTLTNQTTSVVINSTTPSQVKVYANSLTNNVTTSGTSEIILNPQILGTWSHPIASYITNNIILDGNVNISGNIYYQTGTLSYSSGIINATGSTLNIGGNTNLQTNPVRWFNISNLAASNVNLINDLYWTGTWSATTGTITLTGPGLISPTASSRINFSGTSNVIIPDSVLGTTMSSITLTTSGTTQLRGTISCSELLTLGGSGAINNASGFTGFIRTGGGLLMTGNASGTATIILTGGTWSASGANYLLTNVNLDGNIRIGSNIYYATGTMSHISGNIDTSTNFSTLTISGTTKIDTSNINWYNVFFVTGGTINLQSNLLVNNIFRITQVDQTFTTNTNSVINCGHFQYVITSPTAHNVNMSNIPIYTKDFTASGLGSGAALSINNNTFVSGDLTVTGGFGHGAHLYGGTISMVGSGTITTTSAIKSNLIINTGGKINITGTYFLGSQGPSGAGGANMTYIKGNVVAKGATLSMVTNAAYPYILTGMNKLAWKAVLITSGANITMNQFFSGTPDVKTTILPSSTGTYSVTFTDNFEKVARYVNPTNLWVRPGQLLITTDGKKSFSTNRGIRYINSSPNGLSKNTNLTSPQLGTFLLNDPTMTKF